MNTLSNVGEPTSDALENQFGLADRVIDEEALANSVHRFAEQGITLPTFAQLADPSTFDASIVAGVDKNAADPKNLWRVHWYNQTAGPPGGVPGHALFAQSPTGGGRPTILGFCGPLPLITPPTRVAAPAP